MMLAGKALRVTIFVDDDDTWQHKPLYYTEIVHCAHTVGLAGASVFHGVEGFGASSHLHEVIRYVGREAAPNPETSG